MKSLKRMNKIVLLVIFAICAMMVPSRSLKAQSNNQSDFSITPSQFAPGVTNDAIGCFTFATNGFVPGPDYTLNTGDPFAFTLPANLGTLNSVDTAAIVYSSTLISSDFSVSIPNTNSQTIKFRYTNANSKAIGAGDSICAEFHFTSSVTIGTFQVTYASKFTGKTGVLPFVDASIINFVQASSDFGQIFTSSLMFPANPASTFFPINATGDTTFNGVVAREAFGPNASVMPIACTIDRLQIFVFNTGGATAPNTLTVTLFKSAGGTGTPTATPLSATATTGAGASATGSVSVAAGDTLAYQLTISPANNGLKQVSASIRCK